MRRFYLQNQDRIGQSVSGQFDAPRIGQTSSGQLAILQTLTGKSGPPPLRPFTLSWSHYVFLLGVKNPDERSFYEIEASEQNWTVRELKRQFDSGLYERLALSRDKEGIRRLAQEGQTVGQARDLLKEPLVLEFLGLDERSRYSESDLESAIISQIEHFLLEMGKGFLFEARQKRFTFDEDHFFVDLVFYNRLLRCYVLLDLKIGKIAHQDLGQMQMYVNYFDRFVKTGRGEFHHRHRALQAEEQGAGGNHPAQGRQHPRAGVSALPAQQRRVAAKAPGVDRGTGCRG